MMSKINQIHGKISHIEYSSLAPDLQVGCQCYEEVGYGCTAAVNTMHKKKRHAVMTRKGQNTLFKKNMCCSRPDYQWHSMNVYY